MTDFPVTRVLADRLITAFRCDQHFLFFGTAEYFSWANITLRTISLRRMFRADHIRSRALLEVCFRQEDNVMIRISMRSLAVLIITASVSPLASAQHGNGCQPTCAVPEGPMCALPPSEPTCSVPSGCSTGGSCYQPQQINYEPQRHGLFRSRPMFNWTKIHIDNREKCCQPQWGQPAQAMTMAAPMMTMQPVQLQMTAYQPMMAAPQFVQAAPQFVQAAPQFVQAAPQFVQQAPQFVQQAPQFVQQAPQFVQVAPQVQQVTFRPQVAAAPQAATDECNINNVCEKLALLRQKVDDLESRIGSSNTTGISALEKRIDENEKAIRLQTEILDDIRNHLKSKE